jgi:23S rRNA pseudouridine2605 synthase
MNNKKKSKSAAPKAKRVSTMRKANDPGKKSATKTRKAGAKSKAAVAKSRKTKTETVSPAKRAPKTRTAVAKTKEPVAKTKTRKVKAEDATMIRIGEPVVGPIGDISSGEAATYLGDAELVSRAEAEELRAESTDVVDAGVDARTTAGQETGVTHLSAGGGGDATEVAVEPHPPARLPPVKLERLQKILSQAGIASRRHAEEMIVAGRVMVNGQVVTTLGSKADPARDHIRVDGKLVQGAERHRYLVLNKPKGYVTTVSDPEGRPTVMDFVAKTHERLYPVGRLDYQSEGLLLMTNDGELANLLTKAGSGVEKTYLVKVAGQPSEEDLERLRGGVSIERDVEGSERVRSAPARIRPVREGDNPWYEVVLIEGRNRELRKMFSAVGHFVEKIRRVGYGPLVLDVEPGKLRELTLDEVRLLRLTAEGKMKPKHMKVDRIPPAEARRAPEKRGAGEERPRRQRDDRRPQSSGARTEMPRWKQEERGPKREWQPRSEGVRSEPKARPEFRSAPRQDRGENRFGSASRAPFKPRGDRPEFRSAPRQDRGENRFGSAPRAPFKPRGDRPEFRPAPRQDRGENRFGSAPRAPFKPRGDRPQFRPAPRPEGSENRFGGAPRAPFKPRGDRPEFRPAPRQDRGENRFGSASRVPFKPRADRPQWKRDDTAKPRLQVERIAGPEKTASFGGGKPKPSFGAKPGLSYKPGGFGKYRGNTRGGPKRGFSRPGAPRGGRKRG